MARELFGTRLRSLRECAGISLKQLAEKVGTDEYHVAAWERNIAPPEMAMVLLLSVALGVPINELLPGESVSSLKSKVRLTADNFAEHLSTDYASSLVKGFTVPADGIDPGDWIVSKLLAWVELQSDRSLDVRYEMARVIAAVYLERLASPL